MRTIHFSMITYDRWRACAEALEAHGNATDAAAALGWKRQQVYDVIHRMKKAGIIEQTAPYACSYASSQQRAGTLRAGRILEAAQAYDRDFQRWLVGQIPEGGTLAELLMAVAFDAYLDEVGQHQEAA